MLDGVRSYLKKSNVYNSYEESQINVELSGFTNLFSLYLYLKYLNKCVWLFFYWSFPYSSSWLAAPGIINIYNLLLIELEIIHTLNELWI